MGRLEKMAEHICETAGPDNELLLDIYDRIDRSTPHPSMAHLVVGTIMSAWYRGMVMGGTVVVAWYRGTFLIRNIPPPPPRTTL